MKSNYKIEWTYHVEKELKETINYQEKHWTKKEVRRAVINKHNTIFYRTNNNLIEILFFFANRSNPTELKLE